MGIFADKIDKAFAVKNTSVVEALKSSGYPEFKILDHLGDDGSLIIVMTQHDYDRVVFLHVDMDGIVVGVNFHQGCDEVDEVYSNPCPHVTELFRRLGYGMHKYNGIDRVNKAIELYIHAFIFMGDIID